MPPEPLSPSEHFDAPGFDAGIGLEGAAGESRVPEHSDTRRPPSGNPAGSPAVIEKVCPACHRPADFLYGDPGVCTRCHPAFRTQKSRNLQRSAVLESHLGQSLVPCKECGAPLLNRYPPTRAQGNYWHPDVPLSPYEAVNLLEALKLVKDTGDWHGQLRMRCEAVIAAYGEDNMRPNATAEEMQK